MTRLRVWLTGRQPVRRWVINSVVYCTATACHLLTQALA